MSPRRRLGPDGQRPPVVRLPHTAYGNDVQRRAMTNALALLIVLAVGLALFNRGSGPVYGFAVTRKSPPPNTFDAALTSWVWLEFDKAVNHESVEKNLKVAPAVKGHFIWGGDTVVAFVPDVRLAPDTPYTVTLGAEAQNSRSVEFGRQVVWRFRTIPKDRFQVAKPLNPSVRLTEVVLGQERVARVEATGHYAFYKVGDEPLTPERVQAIELHFLAVKPGIESRVLELLNQYNRRQMTRSELVDGLSEEIKAVNGTAMAFTGLSYAPQFAEGFGTIADGILTYRDFLWALRDFVRVDGPDVFKKKLTNIAWRDPTLFDRYMRDVKDPMSFVGVAPGFITNLVTGEIQYGSEVLNSYLEAAGITVYEPEP